MWGRGPTSIVIFLFLWLCLLLCPCLSTLPNCGYADRDFSVASSSSTDIISVFGDATFYLNICGSLNKKECVNAATEKPFEVLCSYSKSKGVYEQYAFYDNGNGVQGWDYLYPPNPDLGLIQEFQRFPDAGNCTGPNMTDPSGPPAITFRQLYIVFACDSKATYPVADSFSLVVDNATCHYNVSISTPIVCPPTGSSMSIVYYFLICINLLIGLYLVLGCLYTHAQGRKGMERCPNYRCWVILPSLFNEYCCSCCAQKREEEKDIPQTNGNGIIGQSQGYSVGRNDKRIAANGYQSISNN